MQEAKTRHQILSEKYQPLIADMVKSLSDPARTEYLRLKREVQPLMNQHLSTLKESRLEEKKPHKRLLPTGRLLAPGCLKIPNNVFDFLIA